MEAELSINQPFGEWSAYFLPARMILIVGTSVWQGPARDVAGVSLGVGDVSWSKELNRFVRVRYLHQHRDFVRSSRE